jgi:hypothetical protein
VEPALAKSAPGWYLGRVQAGDRLLDRTTRWLTHLGGAALLAGAIDPLEGSIVCVVGSGLLAVAAYRLAGPGSALLRRRLTVFGLMVLGVAALWIVSAAGGIGGIGGRSGWWALAFLPYPAAWALGVWDRSLPRWIAFGAFAVGLWYLVLGGLIATKSGAAGVVPVVLLATGAVICAVSLRLQLQRTTG